MNLRSPWVAVAVAAGSGALLYLGILSGANGIKDLALGVLTVAGIAGPIVAAVHLAGPAKSSRLFRRRLLAILAAPAVVAGVAAWLGQGGMYHTFTVVLVFMATAILTVCALIATGLAREGREEFDGVARSLWTLVLAGAIYCASLPAGWVVGSVAQRRARSWIEAAAVEVRSVQRSTGRLPDDLREVMPRVGPPPRAIARTNGGYRVSAETGSFEFRIEDPEAFLIGYWIYDGKAGEWSYVSD